MKIDKEGKLDMFSRDTWDILEEFSWNVEELADEIIELRKTLNEVNDD